MPSSARASRRMRRIKLVFGPCRSTQLLAMSIKFKLRGGSWNSDASRPRLRKSVCSLRDLHVNHKCTRVLMRRQAGIFPLCVELGTGCALSTSSIKSNRSKHGCGLAGAGWTMKQLQWQPPEGPYAQSRGRSSPRLLETASLIIAFALRLSGDSRSHSMASQPHSVRCS